MRNPKVRDRVDKARHCEMAQHDKTRHDKIYGTIQQAGDFTTSIQREPLKRKQETLPLRDYEDNKSKSSANDNNSANDSNDIKFSYFG